jgi:hypothetical protein
MIRLRDQATHLLLFDLIDLDDTLPDGFLNGRNEDPYFSLECASHHVDLFINTSHQEPQARESVALSLDRCFETDGASNCSRRKTVSSRHSKEREDRNSGVEPTLTSFDTIFCPRHHRHYPNIRFIARSPSS